MRGKNSQNILLPKIISDSKNWIFHEKEEQRGKQCPVDTEKKFRGYARQHTQLRTEQNSNEWAISKSTLASSDIRPSFNILLDPGCAQEVLHYLELFRGTCQNFILVPVTSFSVRSARFCRALTRTTDSQPMPQTRLLQVFPNYPSSHQRIMHQEMKPGRRSETRLPDGGLVN
jgi:hypothetical protein